MGLNEDKILLWEIQEKDQLEIEAESRSVQTDADAEGST